MSRWSGGEFTKRPISNLTVDPVFGWSAPYHSCWAWARPAIISPSPATDWPDCGHPFVSFQMTIKMGATAEDSRTGNRQTFGHVHSSEPASAAAVGILPFPPITNSSPLKLLSSLWFTTVPVVDFLNVIWPISRRKLNRIAASSEAQTYFSLGHSISDLS